MTYPFLFSFIWLRIKQPNVPRAFKIPGGLPVAILCTLPPGAIGTAYLYVCIFVEVDRSFGVPYFNVLCTVAVMAVGVVVQLIYGHFLGFLRHEK
jgi:hypothetical protein